MVRTFPLVLAFGDSLVAGYGLPPADGFAAQLERCLRPAYPHVRVVNEGRSGDTTSDGAARIARALLRLDSRPDLAIVQLGPNDVLRQVPASTTRASLDAILTELNRWNVPTLLTTVAPPPVLASRAATYLGIHEDMARRHGFHLLPFFPPGVLGHPDMVLGDRVHPNARAIAAVVAALAPAINEILHSVSAKI